MQQKRIIEWRTVWVIPIADDGRVQAVPHNLCSEEDARRYADHLRTEHPHHEVIVQSREVTEWKPS